jgi:hypothetical protein
MFSIDLDPTPPSGKHACREFGKKIQRIVRQIIEHDSSFLAEKEQIYWEKVDDVIEKRLRLARRAHQDRIETDSEILRIFRRDITDSLGVLPIETRALIATKMDEWIGNYRSGPPRNLPSNDKGQFKRLLNRTIKEWKTLRDRHIKEELHGIVERNRACLGEDVKQRHRDLNAELDFFRREMTQDRKFSDIVWLWSDTERIDYETRLETLTHSRTRDLKACRSFRH